MYYLVVVDEWCSDDAGASSTRVYDTDSLAQAWAIERNNNYAIDIEGYSSTRVAYIEVVHD